MIFSTVYNLQSFMVTGPALEKFDSTHGCFIPNACFGRNTYE